MKTTLRGFAPGIRSGTTSLGTGTTACKTGAAASTIKQISAAGIELEPMATLIRVGWIFTIWDGKIALPVFSRNYFWVD
jgi:hypothetical protein